MKEGDRMRFVEEGALSAYETYFQVDGTLMSRVAKGKKFLWKVKSM